MGYEFGHHQSHLKALADEIARRHGAWHINHTEPDGTRRGWFECESGETAGVIVEKVLADVKAAGGVEKLRRRRRDGPKLKDQAGIKNDVVRGGPLK